MKLLPALLCAILLVLAQPASAPAKDLVEGEFVHHVLFWLKEPDNAEQRAQFLEALRELKTVPTIRASYIGKPAGTDREVVDGSWTFDWIATFEDKAGWQVYNDHPIHMEFIERVGHLWDRVQVYDSIKED
jgi:hypothetical protein